MTPLKEMSQIIVTLESCVVLAGFAAIVGTLQPKKTRRITKGRIVSLAMIIYISLVNALLAAFTLILANFGISDQTLWSASSFAMSLATAFSITYLWIKKRLRTVSKVAKIIYFALFGGAGCMVIINLLNAFGLGFNREYGPYFLSFVFNLFIVGYAFTRLLMRPLWAVVIENEQQHARKSQAGTR
ncbi:hypothetical protein ACJJIC_17590 [Microbulbifer sp. ANSA002]|uniref:hypothetical protein n=1 Tax=unclassified Microbulbifer TaxID=2619833 RepID=UPI004043714E